MEFQRPTLDIMFITDSTGSMAPAIEDVKKNMILMAKVFYQEMEPFWNTRIGLASYKDMYDPELFSMHTRITCDMDKLEKGLNELNAIGGGDAYEAQLLALYFLATSPMTTGWRHDSDARFIIWWGDQPGHDPVGYNDYRITLPKTIHALKEARIEVIGISVTPANRLNYENQVTDIINVVGGELYEGVSQIGITEKTFEYIKKALPGPSIH
ncbi:MAG: VWA domain-containing protein [Trichodesmium sp. St19_bin1]|nr:VWA domain-containing protein [Trichodesmium sp. St19_bin1]